MTIGEKFVVIALRNKDLRVLEARPEWFYDEEEAYYKFVKNYYVKHAALPTVGLLEEKFSISCDSVEGTVDYYEEEIKGRYIFTEISRTLPSLVTGLKKSPFEGLDKIKAFISNVNTDLSKGSDHVYSEQASERFSEYVERVGKKGITYLPYNNEVLDSYLLGYEKTDLITFGGRSGIGKSWLLIILAILLDEYLNANDLTHMGPILVVTNEMSHEQFKERMDCVRFRLPYGAFTKGELTKKQTARYKRGLDTLEEVGSNIILLENVETIDDLETKIVYYSPSMTFIDGSYLLEPQMEEGYSKTVFITRNLKKIAKRRRRPIFNTTQLRKGKGKENKGVAADGQDEFYHGSYIQDSDFALRGFQNPTLVYEKKVGIEIVKGRRVPTGTVLHMLLDLLQMEYDFIDSTEAPAPEAPPEF